MPERFSIDDYFAQAREREEQPLMTPEHVSAVVGKPAAQRALPQPAAGRPWFRPAPVFVGAAALVLALVLLPFVLFRNSDTSSTAVQQLPGDSGRAFTDLTEPEAVPHQAEPLHEAPTQEALPADRRRDAAAGALHQQSVALYDASEMPPVAQALLTLSGEQLARLGIGIASGRASYIDWTAPRFADIARRLDMSTDRLLQLAEQGSLDLRSYLSPVEVVIRTNGIGTQPIGDAVASRSSAFAAVPRMVGVYTNGTLMASYWHRSDDALVDRLRTIYGHLRSVGPDSIVHSLVPVHFRLENPRDQYFSKADIVLWYEATPEFIRSLPEPYRSKLGSELDGGSGSTTGGRYTGQSSDDSGAIASLHLYPNPVNGSAGQATLRYRLTAPRTVTLSLHDIFGRELLALPAQHKQAGDYEAALPLANRESGVYLVALTTDGNERVVRRLVLQR